MLLKKLLLISLCLSSVEANQEIIINGNDNIVKQIVNKGLSPQTVTKFMKPYKDRISTLERQLNRTVSIEEKYRLSEELNKAKKILKRKNEEILSLNQFIENSNLKVVREATKIYEEKGLEATLEYFKSQNFKKFEENTKKNMKELAGGYMFQAKVLELDNKYDQAKKAYKKALKYDRSMENLYDISTFLYTQKYYNETIQYYNEILENTKLEKKSSQLQYMSVETLEKLAICYYQITDIESSENSHLKALTLCQALRKDKNINQSHLNELLSRIYGNLGQFYSETGKFNKAKDFQLKALEIIRILIKEEPFESQYLENIGYRLLNLGVLYGRINESKNAEKYLLEALETFEKLSLNDSDSDFKMEMGTIYDNLGFLYENLNQKIKAENFYKQALKIKKNLFKTNPRAYSAELSNSLIRFGNFYKSQQNIKKAKQLYLEILKIKEKSIEYSSKIFLDNLLNGLINLGEIYLYEHNLKKSEELYLKALNEIENINNHYKITTIENSEYQREKSKVLNYLGSIYLFENKRIKAKKYYKQSLTIKKKLMTLLPNEYSLLFAKSLILGVMMYNEPIKTLDMAKDILEKNKSIEETKMYLDIIEKLKREKM